MLLIRTTGTQKHHFYRFRTYCVITYYNLDFGRAKLTFVRVLVAHGNDWICATHILERI